MIFFSYIPIILVSCINFWFLSAQNCTNPLLNYDIFDDIIFYGYPTLLTETLGMCNLTIGNYSCCSALNANDIGVVYDKFKTRIEDYNSDWILNYKNLFNPFLDLDTMGITNDVPDLLTDLKEVIINYRKEIQKINKLQSQCASTMIQMFAGSLCMTCLPEYENFMSISNPEQTNTSFSKYTIFFANSNCDKINDNCREYLELRKTLETRIYFYMVEIIDTLTAYIGEMPYQNISLLSSLFSNASALSDTNLNSRLLSTPSSKEESPNKNDEYDNNNLNNIDLDTIYEEVEPEYETIDSYSNIANLTSISSPYSLDRISRRLKSSGRGSSGGRSSGSRSSGRSSSSSSSSSSGRSTGSSSSSTSSSSGSSSTTTSSTGSSGGRSVYSSRTTYGARTTTASRTVKSSSTARSSFTRSSTSSAYNSYSTRSSRTYSYSRTNYIIIYNSGYGSRYRGYYYRNRYGTNQEKIIEQSNGSTGVSYQIAKADDYQGILSPFYLGTNFPADVQIQEANYHKIYVDWINGMVDGMNLIENCPIGKSKCRVCVSGNCSYFTKSTSEYYDKYCNIEKINDNTGFICNICIDESCDLEMVYTRSALGVLFPLSFSYSGNRFTIYSERANYKPISKRTAISDDIAISSFKNNPLFSPRTKRIIPSDVALPIITIPSYTSPCSDENYCKTWMCSNFFDGIIPEASKIANPQVNSRSPVTSFDNSTQQSVSVAFKDGGFDAYKQGEKSGLNSTALIDDVNIWSSDGVDSL